MNVILNIGLGTIDCADIHALDVGHGTRETAELLEHMKAGNPHAIERARTLVLFYKFDPGAQLHPTPSDEALAKNPMAATAPKAPSQLRTVLPKPEVVPTPLRRPSLERRPRRL